MYDISSLYYIAPSLIIFVVIFTLLHKLSFPSSQKNVNVMIALLISIIPPVYSYSYGIDFFSDFYDFFGQVGMFFYLGVFLTILFAAFGKPIHKTGDKASGGFLIIIIGILAYSVINSFYAQNLPGFQADWLHLILIVSCFYLAVSFVTKGVDLSDVDES